MPGIFSEFGTDAGQEIPQNFLQEHLSDTKISDATTIKEQADDKEPGIIQSFIDDFGFNLGDFLKNPFSDSKNDIPADELEKLRDEEFKDFLFDWVDSGHDNCFAFACGWLTDPDTGEYFDAKPAPGDISGRRNGDYMPYFDDIVHIMDENGVRETLEKYWSKDCAACGKELIPVDSGDYQPKEGERLVAMMYSDQPFFEDFHFMVKGQYDTWYHKPGLAPPKRTDDSGEIITDPATCNRGIYNHFCGYYIVRDMK